MAKIIFVNILSTILFLSASTSIIADDNIQMETDITNNEPFMRQAFDLAINAGKKGNHTFGALLVYQGRVILTAENTVYTENDITRHAETNLMTEAKRVISPEVLRQSTLYTSTAPCMSCCSWLWYIGITKIVYGVSYESFTKLKGHKDNDIPCNKLYQGTDKTVEWVGPVLEKEGLKVFCYWPNDSYRPILMKILRKCGKIE